jgi:hypothetical protein
MLYPRQRKIANMTGISLGLLFVALILFINIPSKANPNSGLTLQISSDSAYLVFSEPDQDKPFIELINAQPGETHVGMIQYRSERGDTVYLNVRFTEESQKEISANLDLFNQLTITIDDKSFPLSELNKTQLNIPIDSLETLNLQVSINLPEDIEMDASEILSLQIIPVIKENRSKKNA